MIKAFRPLLRLMIVPCFFLSMGCSSDDKGTRDSVNLDGVFVAESNNEYVKMVSIKTDHRGVGTFAVIHHQIPVIDFKTGLQTSLTISYSPGLMEGETSLPVGFDLPGGVYSSSHYVSEIDFVIESSNQLKYRVRTWKDEVGYYDKTPVSSVSGYLVKTDSSGVLSFFEKEVGSLKQQNIGYTLGFVDQEILVHGEKQKFDESYCQSHFLNSCSQLVRLGLLTTHTGSLNSPISNSPVVPNSGPITPNPGSPLGETPRVYPKNPKKQQKDPSQIQTPLLKEEWKMIIDPPGSPDEKPYPYIKIEKGIDIKTFVDNATIRCEDEDDCLESATLLIGFDGDSVFQCSATHIGNGYFTSNAHCMPSSLSLGSMSYNANCSGSLWVKFPKTSNSEPATYECEKLLMVTLMDENESPKESRDMMIFKVKGEVNREHSEVNWEDHPSDGDLVTFWPSDPDRSQPGIHGVIRKKTCEVSDKRELAEILEHMGWDYYISYLKNCSRDIIKGNSGSTAMNGNHEGTLVISHTYGRETGRGIGSNYICSQSRLENGEMTDKPINCFWISDEKGNLLKEKIELELEEERSRQWYKQNDEIQSFLRALYEVQNNFYRNNEENREKIYEDFFSGSSYYDLAEGHVSDEDIEDLKKYLRNFSDTVYDTNVVGFESRTEVTNGGNFTHKLELSPDFGPMELTTSNGNKHELLSESRSRTGLKLESVTLPSCIGPLSEETLESYRSDRPYWPFDTKAYHPIKIRFPVVMVRQVRWANSPKILNWNELEKLQLEFKDRENISVSTVFDIELSDFYDSENDRLKNPAIKITEVNHVKTDSMDSEVRELVEFWFYEKVKEKLRFLNFCE